MKVRTALIISFLPIYVLMLGGCVWVAEQVVDNAAGFPATELAADIKKTSDDYEEKKHEERVEGLNKEYDEFLRSKEAAVDSDEGAEQSVVIMHDNAEDQ